MTNAYIMAKNDLLRANIEKKMNELEFYLQDLNKQKAQIRLERGLRITKPQILEFVAELIKGDPNDKAFQRKIIDQLVYKVYISDGSFFVLVAFFEMNKTEHIDFDDTKNAIQSVLGCSSSNTIGAPKKLSIKSYFERGKKMLEFAGRLNIQKLYVKEFKHWVIVLKDNPATLGHSVFLLKEERPDFAAVTKDEMAEFPEVCKWFEDRCRKIFSAERFNYQANMMRENFVHFNCFPRYSKEIIKYGKKWVDTDWPKIPSGSKLEITEKELLAVKFDLTK